jgi:DNA primase
MSVVDEIKGKLDIVSYIQRTVPLKRAGRAYKACCPFHHERTPSFVVNADNQSWRCFGSCAEGGDIFSFAMKQNGWSFREALEELGKMAGVEVRDATPEQKAKDETNDRLRGIVKAAADFYHDCLLNPDNSNARATLDYARKKRGLTDETIRRYQIGFAPPGYDHLLKALTGMGYSENDLVLVGLIKRNDTGKIYDAFRNRLMIPIRDERGRAVGFGARALAAEDNPKYLNSPQSPIFDKSRLLFGLDTAAKAIRESEIVVIVEGYLDALQAQQAGYMNVVAQMGTALTETQLKLVAPRWAKKIILALDSDAAGQNATRRSLEVAREALQADYSGRLGVEFRVLSVPGAKDPDDLIRETPEQWSDLVMQAAPVADFVITIELTTLPPNSSIQEREEAARRLLPILGASEDDLYRKDNVQKLALKLRLPERDVLLWANEQQKKARAASSSRAARSSATMEEPPPFGDTENDANAAPIVPMSAAQEARIEATCLRALFINPDGFYAINRKLRELANSNPELVNGVLGDFCAEDFTRTSYRRLMAAFEGAISQDELEFVEFLRRELDNDLLAELDRVMEDEWDILSPRLTHGGAADLVVIRRQYDKAVVNDQFESLVLKALRLRERRLLRERQEIIYLQIEQGDSLDIGNMAHFENQAIASIHAKRLIDMELRKQHILHALPG